MSPSKLESVELNCVPPASAASVATSVKAGKLVSSDPEPTRWNPSLALRFIITVVFITSTCLIIFSAVASSLVVKPLKFTAPGAPRGAKVTCLVRCLFSIHLKPFISYLSPWKFCPRTPLARTFAMDWYPPEPDPKTCLEIMVYNNATNATDIFVNPLRHTSSLHVVPGLKCLSAAALPMVQIAVPIQPLFSIRLSNAETLLEYSSSG